MTTNRISFPELARYTHADHPLADRYLIEREIGAGGMAFVFAARDLKHDRIVAVKVLRSDIGSSVNAERFTREIQIAAGLTHPNILPVHDSGAADGLLFYVMPYVEGGTLVERMTRETPMPLGDVRRITREVGAALQFAHAHGIVHRDVKPENVLLPGGVAVVADFGLARAVESETLDQGALLERSTANHRLTQVGVGLGTPAYMSPEQGAGDRVVDARSDQYSLACMVYEMLVGRPPFEGPSYQRLLAQHITETPAPVRRLRPEVPVSVESAIARALSKNADDRFPSIDDFLRALDGEAKGQTASWGIRPAGWRSKLTRGRVAGAAIVGAAVIAAGLFAARGRVRDAVTGGRVDPNLVVVAPFVVLSNSLSMWREGLVDVLARDFDGAGPLRTVSPSTVMRLFKDGRADRVTSLELAKASGAGIVVYGQLLDSGRDSVQASVTVFDVARDTLVGEFALNNAATNMDQVVDSIAMSALRQLGKTRPIAATQRAFFGSHSLPALKMFLQGEQLYRRNQLKAAKEYYRQAFALDSNFALAYHRMRGVLRDSGEFYAPSLDYAARADAANHGMSLRDSLLIHADSLAAAHRVIPPFVDATWISTVRRRIATLEEASRKYADDPEVWTELGEAQVHYGERIGINSRTALEAFQRALAIDSTYGPAFFHAIELTTRLDRRREALRFVQQYQRVNPSDRRYALLAALLGGMSTAKVIHDLPKLEPDSPFAHLQILRTYIDEPDTYAALYLSWLKVESTAKDSLSHKRILSRRFLFRGRLREALANADSDYFTTIATAASGLPALVQRGILKPPAASALLRRIATRENVATMPLAFPAWLRLGDTVSLHASLETALELERTSRASTKELAHYAATAAQAYLQLARGDSTKALQTFLTLADSSVQFALVPIRLDVARLLVARGSPRDAATYLDARPLYVQSPFYWEIEWDLVRARLARQLNDPRRARDLYASVSKAWSEADPELQPFVNEARTALRDLPASTASP